MEIAAYSVAEWLNLGAYYPYNHWNATLSRRDMTNRYSVSLGLHVPYPDTY